MPTINYKQRLLESLNNPISPVIIQYYYDNLQYGLRQHNIFTPELSIQAIRGLIRTLQASIKETHFVGEQPSDHMGAEVVGEDTQFAFGILLDKETGTINGMLTTPTHSTTFASSTALPYSILRKDPLYIQDYTVKKPLRMLIVENSEIQAITT